MCSNPTAALSTGGALRGHPSLTSRPACGTGKAHRDHRFIHRIKHPPPRKPHDAVTTDENSLTVRLLHLNDLRDDIHGVRLRLAGAFEPPPTPDTTLGT